MNISYVKYIDEGYCIPRFYGIAYQEMWAARFVCYPIPFNKIVGWSRKLYRMIQSPPSIRCRSCKRKDILT